VLDARTAAYADARRLVETLSRDMGNDLSEAERQLVKRAALVGAIVADFEARWVTGESVRLSDYLSACNVQRRLLATLGLKRQAKTIGSTFGDRRREFDERQRLLEREQRERERAAQAAARTTPHAAACADAAAGPRGRETDRRAIGPSTGTHPCRRRCRSCRPDARTRRSGDSRRSS
jgi:hypothetical protein